MKKPLSATRRILKSTVLIFMVAYSIATHSIVMRHDVDPEAYLLNIFTYPSVFSINGCTATLIAPRWVLTAAHCVESDSGVTYERFDKLVILGEEVEVESAHVHPAFELGNQPVHDIALLELSEPSTSIIATPPYEGSDEQGQVMKLAGYGNVGDAFQGIYDQCFPCDLRGADNIVTIANDNLLRFRFDHPTDGESLALEGVGGPGDSGGPAYLESDGTRFVAGVSSSGQLSYGDFDQYTRVSKELDWLAEVMGDEYPGFYSGPLYSGTVLDNAVPASGSGSVGLSFVLMLLCIYLYRGSARISVLPVGRLKGFLSDDDS